MFLVETKGVNLDKVDINDTATPEQELKNMIAKDGEVKA
ncbi:unnamed protein product [Anisakis simplex]|uniref:Uncharacterized protein n=1 Tax=Anisakis simplex TaxID=6269 RepID=A0A3P6UL09_ANISI|nr:unnamed protein product [Anisakis simplex]